jgi:hypothetical protein
VVGVGARDGAALAAAVLAELSVEPDERLRRVRLEQLSWQRHYVQVRGIAAADAGGSMPASVVA